MTAGCVAAEQGQRCGAPVEAGAPLELCAHHFQVAGEWVSRRVGLTDALPFPCAACGSRLGVFYPSGWLCAICEWRQNEIPLGSDGAGGHPRVDVVYYLRWHDRVKIGTSGNPRMRFASIAHDEVLAFERGGRELERRRHAQFAAHRTPGSEWFAQHDELTEHMRVLGAGILDPWSEYKRWVSELVALRG